MINSVSVKHVISLLILACLSLSAAGCGKNAGFHAMDVPTDVARPSDLEDGGFSAEIADLEDDVGAPPTIPSTESTGTASEALDEAKATPKKRSLWSSVISVAKWVIQYERRDVGNGCNFFIQRVFDRLGLGGSHWVANNFDQYVKANFKSFKVKTFNNPDVNANRANLREYLWSQPERTGFVFQWKRKGGHGHVAFIQRVQNTLVIYHANMNKFRPKAQKATIETLLSKTGDNNTLNVFSEFQK